MGRFDLSDIDSRNVASATLRLYCIDGSDSGGIIGHSRADWNEQSVTYRNAPQASGAPINSVGRVKKATWYEVDVTDLFSGGNMNAVSIRITSNSWNRAGYSSKEGSEPPQLVVQMKDENSPMGPTMAEPDISGLICKADSLKCPDGSFVSRNAGDGCNFDPCVVQMSSDAGFFPVWRNDGSIGCVVGTAPSWVEGAYLKESKSDCCEAFFMLKVRECLET